ncbi:MAG TPA: flavin prenyltransferase UbiX [Chthonomonadales bacterium]|nr:flavin prenyltransferase UbiX [Chthonomonadales bacterium]
MRDGTGRLVVAITGASGAIYGVRLLQRAAEAYDLVHVVLTEHACQVLATELGIVVDPAAPTSEALLGQPCAHIKFLSRHDFFTPPASGSYRHDGMVIVPCSMGVAGRIAHGISDDLVTRGADVCLKERRRLVLVVRETPWSLVHLRNLTALAEAGATILPASPSFYNQPASIEDVVDTVVARVLQHLGVDQRVVPQWAYTEE